MQNENTINPISTNNQIFGTRVVSIMKSKTTGMRGAKIEDRGRTYYVPVDLLGLAAGKDAWMRDVLVRCSDCRTPVRAGDMECGMCAACQDKSDAEIEALNS